MSIDTKPFLQVCINAGKIHPVIKRDQYESNDCVAK